MSSANNPTSSADLIRMHSHATVLVHGPRYIMGVDQFTGKLKGSRQLTDVDVKESLVNKYC